MDVNDAESVVFKFLQSLCAVSGDPKRWYGVREIGQDLGLSDNETKDVIQHLESRGMLEWRTGSRVGTGSRGRRVSNRLVLSAVASEQGRQHVQAMSGRTAPPRSDLGAVADQPEDFTAGLEG